MSTETNTLVKLPLMGKSIALDELPGQAPDAHYGIVWEICQQPGDGLGYVVQFTDDRTCRILAWMGLGGTVVECDRPITFVMPGTPVVAVQHAEESDTRGVVRARLHGSDELVDMAMFHDAFPSQAAFAPLVGKGGTGCRTQEQLEAMLGPYASRKMGWRTFTAVSYLAFYLLPRLGAQPGHATGTMGDVLAAFVNQPLADALESLLFRVMTADDNPDDQVSGFERYAARMLEQAGATKVRAIAARKPVVVARLSTTHLFWMRIDETLNAEERATLLSVEACLNRLAMVERRLRLDGVSTRLVDCRESLCALEDQRVMARVADRARQAVDAGIDENPYCTYIPTPVTRGGEWDVRTRFIRACEQVAVPHRLEYRFDCHAGMGLLHAVFGVPPVQAFPESRWNVTASRWESRGDERPAFAACYALRVATMVAACGFGAGMGMRQVLVEGRLGGVKGQPVLSLRFERMSFLNRTLPRIDMGMVARVGETGLCSAADVQGLLDAIAPMEARVDFREGAGLARVEPLQLDIPESRIPLSTDTRYLPAGLAHLLHADRACDLDIEGQNDLRQLDAVQTAIDDAKDSPLLAMARLEEIAAENPVAGLDAPANDVVAAAEAALQGLATPGYDVLDDDGESHSVRLAYFPTLFSRCVVDVVARRDDEEFRAIPDQAFVARSALAKLYLADGDTDAAFARNTECMALAPTSEAALLECAQLLMAAQRPAEAVDILRDGLRVCVREQMANLLYAHLAGAYWALGMLQEALACFTVAHRNLRGASGFDQAINQLVRQLGIEGMPTQAQAQAILQAQGVPIAPTDQVRGILMSAAVGFTDARMFELAWPVVGLVGMDVGNDVLSYLGEMLHAGIPDPAPSRAS